MQTANHFERFLTLGYTRLVPIVPPGAPISEKSSLARRIAAGDDARGKVPGVQWPDGTWSSYDWTASEAVEAERWHRMGAGVGIKTGQGLVLIDADTLDEDCARIIKETIERTCGLLPVRVGRYPKAGYLARTDPDFQYSRIEFGRRDDKGRLQDRVEILADGRQFVAHGIHQATGKPYRWPQGIPPLQDVPHVPAETLLALLADLRPLLPAAGEVVREGAASEVDQESLRGDIEMVRKAVEATPNTSDIFPTREAYRNYGYAIKAAAGPEHEAEGLELFLDWCARWTDGTNDPAVAEEDWRRMKPPFRRGASWLYEIAEKHGTGFAAADAVAAKHFDHEAAAEAEKQAPLANGIFPDLFETGKGDAAKRFSFTPFDEAARTALETAAAPLIKGVLDQGAMTVLYGESNAGKTFVAMDMAYHIARGLEWCGRRTAAFPVLYVAAEGGQGARKRAAALAARYGEASAFHFLLQPVNLLRADADLRPLCEAVRGFGERFGLIVVDTLSRAMAGGDENASTDMGAMVRHLDVLRKATGAHVLVVHHSGKDRAKGARGHSLLRAATDTEIEVVDGQIVVTKQRDLDGAFSRAFSLDVVTLGVDADGDPVTSCTVRVDDAKAVRVGEPTPREEDVLAALSALAAVSPEPGKGASVAEITSYFCTSEAKNMTEKNVRFYLNSLSIKRLVQNVRRGRYKLASEPMIEPMIESIFD